MCFHIRRVLEELQTFFCFILGASIQRIVAQTNTLYVWVWRGPEAGASPPPLAQAPGQGACE